MFDNRCPACDQPVVGTDELLTEVPADTPAHCPHCATNIHVVAADESDIVDAYFDHT